MIDLTSLLQRSVELNFSVARNVLNNKNKTREHDLADKFQDCYQSVNIQPL